MKRNSIVIFMIMVLLVVFSFFTVNAEDISVGISLLTREHVYYNTLEKTAKEVAPELGIEVIVKDAAFDNAKQMSQVQDFVVQGVDAIILSPVSEGGGKAVIKIAEKAGIPVFTMDTTTTGNIISHVATDNYKGGQLAAEYMAETVLNGEGKVAIVTYSEIEACVKREEGFKNIIENNYEDIEILDVQNCSGSSEKAANVTQDMLFKHSDLDAIFAVGDPFGIGALSAIKASGRDIKIVAFDANPSGLHKVKNESLWIADVAQDPEAIAKTTLNYVKDYLNGKSVPEKSLIKPFIVDSSNVDKYLK